MEKFRSGNGHRPIRDLLHGFNLSQVRRVLWVLSFRTRGDNRSRHHLARYTYDLPLLYHGRVSHFPTRSASFIFHSNRLDILLTSFVVHLFFFTLLLMFRNLFDTTVNDIVFESISAQLFIALISNLY